MCARLPFFISAIVLLLSSCQYADIALSSTNAQDEVAALSNLSFKFSNNLVADSQLSKWDRVEYINFEPKIKGRFRWNTRRELVFSPASPLKPATTYTAKLNDKLLKHSKFKKLGGETVKTFHTAPLVLTKTDFLWTLTDGTKQIVPELKLLFNYNVDPKKLNNYLTVKLDQGKVPYKILTNKKSKSIKVAIPGLEISDRDYKVSLTVKKGLVPIGGTNGTPKSNETSSILSSPFQLYVNDVAAKHDGQFGEISIKTSQGLGNLEIVKSKISISPRVDFTLQKIDGGFQIRSEKFLPDEVYDLSFSKGIKGELGGILSNKYSTGVSFGKLQPNVAFKTSDNIYLSKNGNRNIEVTINNVPKVKVILSKIYEENLLAAENNGYYPSESEDEDDEYYYEGNGSNYVKGDVVYEKVIDVKQLPRARSGSRLYTLVPDKVLKDFNGIYHLKIRSTEDYWLNDSRFISMSDIGMISKVGKNKIHVYTNSIASAKPLTNVSVSVYGSNNQLLAKGKTNSIGKAELSYTRKPFKGFEPAMIVAKTSRDFNYLPFPETSVNTSRYDVGGRKTSSSGIDLFLYPERNMYRPGEKINFSMIARKVDRSNPGSLPVKIRIIQPNGKTYKTLKKTLNSQGMIDATFSTSEDALTGTYVVQVFQGNKLLLNQIPIGIEEFVPDRLKVKVAKMPNYLNPGDTAQIRFGAMNFFGAPAVKRNYEVAIKINEKRFNPIKYKDYDFSISEGRTHEQKLEGKTNTDGKGKEQFVIPPLYKNSGLLQAEFYTTVFDETSRPVSRNQKIDIHTQDVYFGVSTNGYRYFPLNKAAKFSIVALDKNEKLSQTKAQIDLIKHEYKNVMTRSNSYYNYRTQEEDKLIESKEIVVNGGKGNYFFTPKSSGDYELRISIPGANSYIKQQFYSYGSWGSSNSFSVNKEGAIDISFDKEKYRKGDRAKILFKTPFNGKLLVSFENENVISEQYVEVKNRTASVTIPLKNKEVPGVYVSATLFKAHQESNLPLTIAHGIEFLKVEDPSGKMNVEITASEKSRSHKKQKIRIKAKPGAMVTLAAVDNGILMVNDYKSPNPYDFFYGKRKLGVSSYDMYALLFPEVSRMLSHTGGDRGTSMNERLNPVKGKRTKLLSYWSGVKKCNGSGYVDFEIDIPEFNGELRLMAVACKNGQFGMAEKSMTVADPIIISTALPRFLSSKDSIPVAVFVTNTTQTETKVKVNISKTGPLGFIGSTAQEIQIPAESERTVMFSAKANNNIGLAKILVEAKGLNETFENNTELPIRPAAPLATYDNGGFVLANQSKVLDIKIPKMVPSSVKTTLIVGRSPILQLGGDFSYLVNYPHGCSEQIISTAFPQLYYSSMAELFDKGNGLKQNAVEHIERVIQQLSARQHYNGGIRLWDDAQEPHWWASVYAADFLTEAKKAGFTVNPNTLNPLMNYLTAKLRSKKSIRYRYNGKKIKNIAPKEVPYSLYVLAKAHRPNIPAMNYYKANKDELALDGKYLLSGAYALAGDKRSFKSMLPSGFSGEKSVAETGGSFYSYQRDLGIALNVLLDADPENEQVIPMSNLLVKELKGKTHRNTQTSVYGLLALGKISKLNSRNHASAQIIINGEVKEEVSNKTKQIAIANKDLSKIKLNVKGNGKMYYWWQSKGVSKSGFVKEEDKFIQVRRSFYDRYGRPLSGKQFEQNDLIVVKVSLKSAYSSAVENIVITDLLPAGFEIENPRIKEVQGMQWVKDASTPQSRDIRDDRIFLFANARVNTQNYYYVVRAVTPGTYTLGPISADAMYNGNFHSTHGGNKVRIVAKNNTKMNL